MATSFDTTHADEARLEEAITAYRETWADATTADEAVKNRQLGDWLAELAYLRGKRRDDESVASIVGPLEIDLPGLHISAVPHNGVTWEPGEYAMVRRFRVTDGAGKPMSVSRLELLPFDAAENGPMKVRIERGLRPDVSE